MIGQSLGRYVIESKLGEGGMGIVFKARDTQLERAVAIKILPRDKVADPDRKRRFVQEAKAASALNHPHIVTIYDIGSDGDTDFIVMEYLAGTTLDHLVPANGLPLGRALPVAIAIADALAKAHEAGIIHRDLKPSNVMVTDAGGVKILDFGVAKLLEPAEPSSATRTVAATDAGTTIGTPGYMSPEQAEGRKLDGRSDIFSLGSVLYEMVTGRKAFSGDSRLSVLAKILNEDPAPPSRFTAAVPPDLEKTILRCLRKDPARRYQTMADLKVALEDLVLESSGTSQSHPPVRASSSLRRWALVPVAAVLVAAVYFAAQSWRETPTSEPLHAIPLTSLSGMVRAPSLSPDGNHVAFSWTGARQDNPDIYVQQIGAGTPLRLTTDPGNDYSPSWSPDGRAIAFLRREPAGGRSEVRLIAPLGGPERRVADIRPGALALLRPNSLAWCPDSTCVVVTESPSEGKLDAVFVISLDTGEKRQLTSPPDFASDADPAISPDGRSLIFRRDTTPFSGEFYRLSLKGRMVPEGEPVRLTSTLVAGRPACMPDGREILFAARGGLWRLDAVGGGTPTRLPFVGQDGLAPVVSRGADGRQRLVYVRSFADANVWRVDTSAPGAPASSPVAAIASTRVDAIPNLSPDGLRVVFLSNRSGEAEIWVAAPDGSNAVQLTSMGINPGFPRWSPDARLIAFHGDPNARPDVLVVPAGGGKPTILTANTRNGAFPSFSRDGRWIYFGAADAGEAGIWKIPVSGGAAVQVTNQAGGSIAIESHDGRDLYYVAAFERPSSVWRLPLAGGEAVKLLDGVVLGNFDVLEGGIYYIDRVSGGASAFYTDRPGGGTRLQYFDFSTRRSTTVVHDLGSVGSGLSASRDGRTIFYSRIDSSVDELMLVDNFR